MQRLRESLRASPDFGPRKPHDRERWELFKKGIIAKGGPPPDTFQLPEGETAMKNSLPDWLTVKEDGNVVPKEEATNSIAQEALPLSASQIKVPK